MLKSGKYEANLPEKHRQRLYFVGDVQSPIYVGRKGEIMDMVDDEFTDIYDVFRWVKCGMMSLDVQKDPYYLCVGVRALLEAQPSGGW